MGESFGPYAIGADEAIVPFITSANLGCGFHGGDPHVMRQSVELCRTHGVKIGAHPGLPDRLGFGRRAMAITPPQARDMVLYQVGALSAFTTAAGLRLQHVKPHGALYMMALEDDALSDAIVDAVAAIDDRLMIYTTGDTATDRAAQKRGLRVMREFFADRPLTATGWMMFGSKLSDIAPGPAPTPGIAPGSAQAGSERSHLKRRSEGPDSPSAFQAQSAPSPALVTTLAARAVRAAMHGKTTLADGRDVPVRIDTICVHSDTLGSPEIMRAIREGLVAAHARISAPSADR